MCETCFELAWRPLMTTSIVTLPCSTTRVAEPEAVVSIPVSLKLSPLGEGDGLGLATIGLGEGEVAAVPPPEAPQAEMVAANATSATTRFKPAVSLQLCSWRYHCRLLDGHSRSASINSDGPGFPRPTRIVRWLGRSGVTPARTAGAAPQHEAEAEKDQDRAHGAQAGDEVVDRGDEVMRGIAESGRESPAVRRSRRHRSTGLSHLHRDGAERHVVLDVLDLAFELLDLTGDLAQLVLDQDDLLDGLRLGQQREHRVALRLLIGESRLKVDVLRADVVAADVLGLDLAHLRKGVDGLIEVRGGDHEGDDARADLVVGHRVGLGISPRDVALLELHQRAHRGEAGIERA